MLRVNFLLIILSFSGARLVYAGHFQEGNKYFLSGKFKEAVKKYNDAQIKQGDLPEIFFNRGNALFKLKKYERAIADYDRVVNAKNNSLRWQSYYNRGCAYLAQGTQAFDKKILEKARADFRAAVKLNPKNMDIRKNLQITAILLNSELKQPPNKGKNQQQNNNKQQGQQKQQGQKQQGQQKQTQQQQKQGGNKKFRQLDKRALELLLKSAREQEKKAQQERMRRGSANQKRNQSGEW